MDSTATAAPRRTSARLAAKRNQHAAGELMIVAPAAVLVKGRRSRHVPKVPNTTTQQQIVPVAGAGSLMDIDDEVPAASITSTCIGTPPPIADIPEFLYQPGVALTPAYDALREFGAVVYRNFVYVQPTLLEAAQRACHSDAAAPIFNFNGDEHRNDKRRVQAAITMEKGTASPPYGDYGLAPGLATILDAYCVQQTGSNDSAYTALVVHNPDSWVAIKSLPGCQRQAAHCDYDPHHPAFTDDAHVHAAPLACLVPLESGTSLDVWPRAHRLLRSGGDGGEATPIPRQRVQLEPGDCLILRGDCVHAGSAYERENIRLHCYLDAPSVRRAGNSTWLVTDEFSASAGHMILSP